MPIAWIYSHTEVQLCIRRIVYTTSSIEAVHRQFRKLTKTKGGFPNDDSLKKFDQCGEYAHGDDYH